MPGTRLQQVVTKRHVRSLLVTAVAALVCSVTGCRSMIDETDNWMTGVRRSGDAWYSWMESRSMYGPVAHRGEFGRGYRAGFRAVASGAGSAPPAIAPRRYRSVWFYGDRGRQASQAWFDGYSHGTLTATMQGEDLRSEIYLPGHGQWDHGANANLVGYGPAILGPNGEDLQYGYGESIESGVDHPPVLAPPSSEHSVPGRVTPDRHDAVPSTPRGDNPMRVDTPMPLPETNPIPRRQPLDEYDVDGRTNRQTPVLRTPILRDARPPSHRHEIYAPYP